MDSVWGCEWENIIILLYISPVHQVRHREDWSGVQQHNPTKHPFKANVPMKGDYNLIKVRPFKRSHTHITTLQTFLGIHINRYKTSLLCRHFKYSVSHFIIYRAYSVKYVVNHRNTKMVLIVDQVYNHQRNIYCVSFTERVCWGRWIILLPDFSMFFVDAHAKYKYISI